MLFLGWTSRLNSLVQQSQKIPCRDFWGFSRTIVSMRQLLVKHQQRKYTGLWALMPNSLWSRWRWDEPLGQSINQSTNICTARSDQMHSASRNLFSCSLSTWICRSQRHIDIDKEHENKFLDALCIWSDLAVQMFVDWLIDWRSGSSHLDLDHKESGINSGYTVEFHLWEILLLRGMYYSGESQ